MADTYMGIPQKESPTWGETAESIWKYFNNLNDNNTETKATYQLPDNIPGTRAQQAIQQAANAVNQLSPYEQGANSWGYYTVDNTDGDERDDGMPKLTPEDYKTSAPATGKTTSTETNSPDGADGEGGGEGELLSATDAVNQAFNEGVQQAAANHSIAKQTQAQQAVQTASNLLGKITNPMNMIQRQAASQLQGYKQAWANYNDAYNRAMEAGDEDTANQYLAQRDKIAGQADSYRQQLNAAGVTLGDAFGANGTLEQAQQVLGADRLAGLNRILGDGNLSSDDVYNRDYQNYINAGASKRQARKWAAENAGNYRLQRISQLNNALGSYGVEADGSINSIGTNIIAAMAREGDAGGLLQSALRPGVKDVWGVDQQRQAREDQFQQQLALIGARIAGQEQLLADRMAMGVGRGSSGMSSGGSRSSNSSASSKIPDNVKEARDYIKRAKENHKNDVDTDWQEGDALFKQAQVIDEDYTKQKLYGDMSLDDDTSAIKWITAAREGRLPGGKYYDKEAIDKILREEIGEDEDGNSNEDYIQELIDYNHSLY